MKCVTLYLFLVFLGVCSVQGCMKKKSGSTTPGGSSPPPTTAAPPPPPAPESTAAGSTTAPSGKCNAQYLGIKKEFKGAYDKKRGGPVDEIEELILDSRKPDQACWKNLPKDEDSLQYVLIPDGAKLVECKTASPLPPHYQVIGIVAPSTPLKGAGLLLSCAVLCSEGPPEVTIVGAATAGVRVEVCLVNAFKEPAHHQVRSCTPVQMGVPTKIGKDKRPAIYSLLLKSSKFGKGDYVAIRSIQVKYKACPDPSKICREAGCGFKKDMCKYKKAKESTSQQQLKNYPQGTIVGNMDSGVNAAGKSTALDSPFAAAALDPKTKVASCAKVTETMEGIEMEISLYDACRQNQAKVCFNGVSNCKSSNQGVSAADRKWVTKKFAVPKGTKKVCLVGDDTGPYYCAVGFGNIQFYYKGKPLCDYSKLEGE